MPDGSDTQPLRERNFYLVETGIGLVATLVVFFALTGVVDGFVRVAVAVVAGLVVSNGLQLYRR
jgi:hypothetical protein